MKDDHEIEVMNLQSVIVQLQQGIPVISKSSVMSEISCQTDPVL